MLKISHLNKLFVSEKPYPISDRGLKMKIELGFMLYPR